MSYVKFNYSLVEFLTIFIVLAYPFTALANSTQVDFLSQKVSNGDGAALSELEKLAATDKDAARALGVHYFKGLGVQPDKKKAVVFFQKASELGDENAKRLLEKLGGSVKPTSTKQVQIEWPTIAMPPKSRRGHGSSFAVNNNGYFVTNFHVVDSCEYLIVNYQGRQTSGKVIAGSKADDLAVIETGKQTPVYLSLSQASAVRGEDISVGGFPIFGYFTYSDGVVSALPAAGSIQISAQISSGNSGGPLTDASGRVLGVIVGAIPAGTYSNTSVGANFNFAIDGSKVSSLLTASSVAFGKNQAITKLNRQQLAKLLEFSTARIDCY